VYSYGDGKYLVPNGDLIYPEKLGKLLLSEPAHIMGNSATARVCFLNVTFFLL
jgi:hypothetical protein